MKTYGRDGSLWKQLISMETLVEAERKAGKSKGHRSEVVRFRKDLGNNLMAIQELLISGKFNTSKYKTKKVFEPKERDIYILPYFPDRIVQHAILIPLEPIFTRLFIDQTFACVPGRGGRAASTYTMDAVRHNDYVLKCDIHKFYPSINHDILSKMLHRKIKDEKFMEVVDNIIYSYDGETNLPIGNYASQWLGNFYLTALDNFVKHTLHIEWYERYCDDFLLFSNNKAQLTKAKKEIEKFLRTELKLEYSYAEVFKVTKTQSVDFVGYRHYKNHVTVRKSTAQRQMAKFKKLKIKLGQGKITKRQACASIDSFLGIYRYACTKGLKKYMNIVQFRHKIGGLTKREYKRNRRHRLQNQMWILQHPDYKTKMSQKKKEKWRHEIELKMVEVMRANKEKALVAQLTMQKANQDRIIIR